MTLEEYRNQQHEIDLVVFHGIFKTQNAHGGWNVLPKMFVGRWWYFLEKCWKTGWSEQDVRDRRMLPWMATGAVPVRIRTATHFSLENSHRETSHRGRTFHPPWAFVASSLTLKLSWNPGAFTPGLYVYYFNFQISLLYSAMVLSEEKKPALAMFTNIIFFHFCRSS